MEGEMQDACTEINKALSRIYADLYCLSERLFYLEKQHNQPSGCYSPLPSNVSSKIKTSDSDAALGALMRQYLHFDKRGLRIEYPSSIVCARIGELLNAPE